MGARQQVNPDGERRLDHGTASGCGLLPAAPGEHWDVRAIKQCCSCLCKGPDQHPSPPVHARAEEKGTPSAQPFTLHKQSFSWLWLEQGHLVGTPKTSGCCFCPEDGRSLEQCCSGPTHCVFRSPITHGFCKAVSAVCTRKEEISS